MRALFSAAIATAFALAWSPAAHADTTTGAAAAARYSFDGGMVGGSVTDDTGGGATLSVRARGGGTVRVVPGASGLAVAFPAPCTGSGCPRAILQGPSGTALDPGSAPIRYGATVLLRAEDASDGSNIVQKGRWSDSSQWKLQIDGTAGRPSCALMGVGSRRLYLARAAVSVADGRWHRLACERVGGSLRILVDGAVAGQAAIPAGLSVRNGAPLRIGGNGVGVHNDQFHGVVDDVFVAVG
jgi:hypothetical protein